MTERTAPLTRDELQHLIDLTEEDAEYDGDDLIHALPRVRALALNAMHAAQQRYEPAKEIFLVICKDRHVDLMVTAHTTRESAEAAIEAFKAGYGTDYQWIERDYGRASGWLRYVDGGDDGPRAYIERSTLHGGA